MNKDQIKHMVQRFLMWRLPENFSPDAGISFKPTFNDHMDPPMRHNPVGTNLFDAMQAEEMVRHMVEGMPGSVAVDDIMAERKRQIEVEGWTPDHDDEHSDEEMARAAACYALGTSRLYNHRGERMGRWLWPWDGKWWKPGPDRRRELVKAGALVVAEIERLDRAASPRGHIQ